MVTFSMHVPRQYPSNRKRFICGQVSSRECSIEYAFCPGSKIICPKANSDPFSVLTSISRSTCWKRTLETIFGASVMISL
jgi:hypothetical protein